MKTNDYQDTCARLERPTFDVEDHAVTGLTSEVGELADLRKKLQVAGGGSYDFGPRTHLDTASVAEEAGDCLYYLAILCNHHGLELSDVMAMNIAKLKRRALLGKDKEAERGIFEDGIARSTDGQR